MKRLLFDTRNTPSADGAVRRKDNNRPSVFAKRYDEAIQDTVLYALDCFVPRDGVAWRGNDEAYLLLTKKNLPMVKE
jgi:hypothetical protein